MNTQDEREVTVQVVGIVHDAWTYTNSQSIAHRADEDQLNAFLEESKVIKVEVHKTDSELPQARKTAEETAEKYLAQFTGKHWILVMAFVWRDSAEESGETEKRFWQTCVYRSHNLNPIPHTTLGYGPFKAEDLPKVREAYEKHLHSELAQIVAGTHSGVTSTKREGLKNKPQAEL